MNFGKKTLMIPGGVRAQPNPHLQSRSGKAGVVQTKPKAGSQIRKAPVAPPVYRPQLASTELQPKMSADRQPIIQSRHAPLAPPVYRPQPLPRVLQTKADVHSNQSRGRPVAPQIDWQRSKRIAQLKIAPVAQASGITNQHQPVQIPSGRTSQSHRTLRPTIYRPQPPPRVLQTKQNDSQQLAASRSPRQAAAPTYRLKQEHVAQPQSVLATNASPGTLQLSAVRSNSKARSSSTKLSSQGSVIQRIIITNNLQDDVEYAKVKRFLVEKAGADDYVVAPGDKVKITTTNPEEPIYILQHGGAPTMSALGTIMHWSPEELLKILKTMGFDPAAHTGKIQLLSCHSAFSLTDRSGEESFAHRFQQLLEKEGYKGKVFGVSGSLNPIGIGKPNEAIEVQHLWQGDPIHTMMKEIDTMRGTHRESLYVIQDYISGDADEPDNAWKPPLRAFIVSAMDSIEICNRMLKSLGEFKSFPAALKSWKKNLADTINRVLAIITTSGNLKASQLPNRTSLNQEIEKLIGSLDEFENIMMQYVEKRKEQGYHLGITGALFKPLQFEEFPRPQPSLSTTAYNVLTSRKMLGPAVAAGLFVTGWISAPMAVAVGLVGSVLLKQKPGPLLAVEQPPAGPARPNMKRGNLMMSEAPKFAKRTIPVTVQQKTAGAKSRPHQVQSNLAGAPPHLAMNQPGRAPIAPPAFRIQAAPKVFQAKMHAPTQAGRGRVMVGSLSGVVQANVIGGHQALQARLNLWNTRLTRGANRTVVQNQRANFAQAPSAANGPQSIQRKTAPGVEAFQVPLRQKSGGLPIPDQVRAKMETAFSADFSDVRVHVGQEASALGAIAYTWGSNIHFAPGQYNPNTIQGQKLLGHELWHVVQQRAGRVSNPFGGGVAVVQDHALEAEADRMGIKAAMTALVHRPEE
jgi:hypothetical protein